MFADETFTDVYQSVNTTNNRSCCHGNGCAFNESGSWRYPSCIFASWSVIAEPWPKCDVQYPCPMVYSNAECLPLWSMYITETAAAQCMQMPQRTAVELIHYPMGGIYNTKMSTNRCLWNLDHLVVRLHPQASCSKFHRHLFGQHLTIT